MSTQTMEEGLRFKLIFETSSARKGLAATRRMAKGLGKEAGEEIGKAEKKADQFGRSLKSVSRGARQVSRDLRTMGSAFGGVAGSGGQALRVVGGLSTSVAAAGGAMGPAGVAAAGFAIGALAAAAATARLAEATFDAAYNARELYDELKPLQTARGILAIDETSLRSFDRMKAGIDAISAAGKIAQLVIAQEFGPSIERITTISVAATLALADMVKEIDQIVVGVLKGATAMTLALTGNFRGAMAVIQADGFSILDKSLEGIEDRLGSYLPKAQQLIKDLLKQADAARGAAAGTKKLAEEEAQREAALQATASAYDMQRQAARDLLTPQEQLLDTYTQQLAKLRELQAQGASQDSVDAARLALKQQLAHAEAELAQQEYENAQRRAEQHQRQHEAEIKRIEERERREREAALAQFQVASDLTNNIVALNAQQFGNSKAAQVAEARVAQLLAFANTIARNPTPLGALQAASAALLVEQQIQGMRSVEPTFHRGGLVGDESRAVVRSGEAYLSPQGRSAIGDDNIRRANSGRSVAPMVIQVRQMYEHRGYNRFNTDNLQIGGPVREAIRTSSSSLNGIDAD